MPSDKQIAASRANGAKSRGPVTVRGKYNSSRNATRHGILSKSLLLPGEDAAALKAIYDEFHEEHRPRTATERALVEELVSAHWRKQRVWSMETCRIGHQMLNGSETDPVMARALATSYLATSSRSLDLYLRYEARFERQFHRALFRLLDLTARPSDPDSDSGSDSDPASRDSNAAEPSSPVPDPPPSSPPPLQLANRTRLIVKNKRPAPPQPAPPVLDCWMSVTAPLADQPRKTRKRAPGSAQAEKMRPEKVA